MKHLDSLSVVKWALAVAVTIVSAYVFFASTSLEKIPAGGYDEQMWTGASISAVNMFFTDYQRPNVQLDGWYAQYAQKYGINLRKMSYEEAQWYDNPMWTFGWKAPNVGKFIMGGAIEIFSDTLVNADGYFYSPNPDRALNKWPGNYAPASMLKIARHANATVALLNIITIIAIGWMFLGYWPGIVAAIYLIANPSFVYSNTQVGLEATSIFFSTLSIFLIMLLARNLYTWRRNKMLLFAFLTGLSFALAVGSKLSGALIGFVLIAIYVIMLVRAARLRAEVPVGTKLKVLEKLKAEVAKERGMRIRRIFLSGAVVAAVGIGVFIWLNPVFHDSPMLKMKIVRESVTEFFDRRAASSDDPSVEINHNMGKSLALMLNRNGIFLGEEVSRHYYGTFGSLMPFKYNFLDFGFFLLGCYFLIRVSNSGHYSMRSAGFILLLSMMILVLGNADFMWIDWSRYHMPIYPTYALIIGVGLYKGTMAIVERVRAEKKPQPATAS